MGLAVSKYPGDGSWRLALRSAALPVPVPRVLDFRIAEEETIMRSRLTLSAITTVLMAGASSGALAQYVCPPGYGYYGGICQPLTVSYSNPVFGAVSGEGGGATPGHLALRPGGAG